MTMPTNLTNSRKKLKRKTPYELALESIEPFKVDERNYNINAAYEAGISIDLLKQLFPEDVVGQLERPQLETSPDWETIPELLPVEKLAGPQLRYEAPPVISEIAPELDEQVLIQQDMEAQLSRRMWEIMVLPNLPQELQRVYGTVPDEDFAGLLETWREEQKSNIAYNLEAIMPSLFENFTPEQKTATAMSFVQQLQENEAAQQLFFEKISSFGRRAETESLLRVLMPGITERDIKIIFGENVIPLEQLSLAIYKVSEQPMEDVYNYGLKDPEGLRMAMRYEGRNADTEAMLKSLYTEEIVTENFLKKYFEETVADKFVQGNWLPQTLQDYIWDPAMQGVGGILSATGGTFERFGNDALANELKLAGAYSNVYGKDIPYAARYSPGWFAQNLSRMAPMMLSMMGLSIITGGVGGAVAQSAGAGKFLTWVTTSVASNIGGTLGESMLEAGEAYNEAKRRGFTDEEATAVFNKVALGNLGGLSLSNTLQYALFFVPGGKTASFMAKAFTFGFEVATQSVEEAGQLYLTRAALDDPQVFDQEMLDNVVLGGVGGFAFGGATTVHTLIQDKIVEKMNPDQYDNLRKDIVGLIGQGMTRKEAEEKAWDKFSETPGAKDAIQAAVDEVRAEEKLEAENHMSEVIAAVDEITKATPVSQKVKDFVKEFTTKGEEGFIGLPGGNLDKIKALEVEKAKLIQTVNKSKQKFGTTPAEKRIAEINNEIDKLSQPIPTTEVVQAGRAELKPELQIGDKVQAGKMQPSGEPLTGEIVGETIYKGLPAWDIQRDVGGVIPVAKNSPELIKQVQPVAPKAEAAFGEADAGLVKEPWEMTSKEFNSKYPELKSLTKPEQQKIYDIITQENLDITGEEGMGFKTFLKDFSDLSFDRETGGIFDRTHKQMVIEAYKRGQDIPENVKIEYAEDIAKIDVQRAKGKLLKEKRQLARGKTPTQPPPVAPESVTEGLEEVKGEIPATQPEVVEPADVEVMRQLDELSNMSDIWRQKLATSEETKVALAKFVRENLPPDVRGKFITAVAKIKTDAQLQTQITRVQEFAEQNAQKVLKAEIAKELKKATAKIKDHILKGKFTPEVQERLNVITHNLNMDRDMAREKMAENIQKYEDGELSYEDMLKANEVYNFAGIDGMTSEELADTLDYIKLLENVGRSERQAKQEAHKEKIKTTVTGFINILTGGKGLKTGVGAVSRKQMAVERGKIAAGWDKFTNWQYSLDNLADKLSKLDPTSKPYQSLINKFVADAHRATARQAIGVKEAYAKFKDSVKAIYNVKSTHDINQVLNGLQEEVNLGTFDLTTEYKANHPESATFGLLLTRDEMIAKYLQMQDPTLDNTFTTGMGWSQKVRDAVENSLTPQEKQLADSIFTFYEEYYNSVNDIYKELYNVNMPHNPRYSPIRRDFEGSVTEQILTFQDASQYASVINGSLKARQKNIRPLKFNGATQILSNHIDQMEHFKAFAKTISDMRRVFGNTQVRQSIEQYHGKGIIDLIDKFTNQMARDGVETAATNQAADYLRRNFTKSILAIKPVVGLKQIPSLFGYVSEMKVTEFFGGIADFWKSPIDNFKFLYANSEGYRARVSQGFERDIRAAVAKHGNNKLSGKTGFLDWFLLQIRMMDTFAEDTTNRTQPSFGIDTLSAIQNGGSWLKLMTMFQNQPNKYFRMVGDNARNFKYGRGSKAKAASTILLTWVVLPMLFQFIADAFQWKKERQLRAGLLGPLNFILIGGQMVQSAWGWLTNEPFDYQVSPVVQTTEDLRNIFMKSKKLYEQGQDPFKDIQIDDVAVLVEYLAKAGGQVIGLPTPYFVQVEKSLRTKVGEDEDIEVKDFIFSQWSMEPPSKNSAQKVEDANLKLGEVKEGQEDLPLTERELKTYTTVDWFREIGDAYSKNLPSDVLKDKKSPAESKAWAKYEMARAEADILPDAPLYKINTEDNADTIIELYQQWQARQRIDSLEKLKEFDQLYPNANLGNVTRQQYDLIKKYLEAEDKDAFLEAHPELKVNPRTEWMKANPTSNALLALGGQAKIQTMDAFNQAENLIKELDIPDSAIPEGVFPPKGSEENYFKYQEIGEEYGWNSWEIQKLLIEDNDLLEFLGREPIDTPVEVLDLKIANRELDPESPEYKDNDRRIEAISKDGDADKWVERGKLIDQYGAGSSEAKVWLLDNPDIHQWAIEQGILTDDGSDWNEDILRLNVEMAQLDPESEKYKALELKKSAYSRVSAEMVDQYVEYYDLPDTGYRRERYLKDNPEFTEAMGLKMPEKVPSGKYDELLEKENKTPEDLIRMEAYKDYVPDEYVERYVEFESLQDKGKPDYWPDDITWRGEDWYLIDHPAFYENIYVTHMGLKERNFENLKDEYRKYYTEEVFNLYETWKGLPQGTERRNFEYDHPDLDMLLHIEKGTALETEKKKTETEDKTSDGKSRREQIAELRERIKR